MTRFFPRGWQAAIFVLLACVPLSAGEIELLGVASLPGDATDRSGFTDLLTGNVPHQRLGGFSAIEYLGGDRYLLLSDRGPADGAANYACRYHEARLTMTLGPKSSFQFELQSTTRLQDENAQPLTGSSLALDTRRPDRGLRFDPEAIRRAPSGATWLADEYGPSIVGFDASGHRTQLLELPARFHLSRPSAVSGEEDALNSRGRQENRGLEGLAISPDGKKLFGLMQGPLLQDSPRNPQGERAGANCRLLEIEIATGASREYVYPLDQGALGLNEILATSNSEFLVIERDGKEGAAATTKKIYRIDLSNAADVSDRERLPQAALPLDQAVKKTLLIDLLDPRYGLSGDKFPQKVEGLTFGPTLPDCRRLLIVCTDNDFLAEKPSWFYFFALPSEQLGPFAWDY